MNDLKRQEKKLLFDLTTYQSGEGYHGGGEYEYRIFSEVLKQKEAIKVDAFLNSNFKMNDWILNLCKENGIDVHYLKDAEELLQCTIENDYTTLYSAMPYHKDIFDRISENKQIKFVYTIHGLRGVEIANEYEDPYRPLFVEMRYRKLRVWLRAFPEYMERRQQRAREFAMKTYQKVFDLTDNRQIITDSYHSLYSILHFFPQLKREEIVMAYAPSKIEAQESNKTSEEVLKKYGIESKNYILMISAERYEKNNIRGVLAADEVFHTNAEFLPKNFKVLVLGVLKKEPYTVNIRHKDKFILEGYADSEDLAILYREAHLFLYPSLNEGFGYPPIEAMKYGTYCACSPNTSISEICGDAVLYFNPTNIHEMATRIMESFDEEYMKEKELKMKKQYEYIHNKQDEDLQKIVDLILG